MKTHSLLLYIFLILIPCATLGMDNNAPFSLGTHNNRSGSQQQRPRYTGSQNEFIRFFFSTLHENASYRSKYEELRELLKKYMPIIDQYEKSSKLPQYFTAQLINSICNFPSLFISNVAAITAADICKRSLFAPVAQYIKKQCFTSAHKQKTTTLLWHYMLAQKDLSLWRELLSSSPQNYACLQTMTHKQKLSNKKLTQLAQHFLPLIPPCINPYKQNYMKQYLAKKLLQNKVITRLKKLHNSRK